MTTQSAMQPMLAETRRTPNAIGGPPSPENRTNAMRTTRTLTVACVECGRETVCHGRRCKRQFCSTACRAKSWRMARKPQ